MFLPSPSDLLVNLRECRELIVSLLTELPDMFKGNGDTRCAEKQKEKC